MRKWVSVHTLFFLYFFIHHVHTIAGFQFFNQLALYWWINLPFFLAQLKAKTFFQRASPMKLPRLYLNLSANQKDLVGEYEYAGLLEIRCSKLQPESVAVVPSL
jgi:hypothetical protein